MALPTDNLLVGYEFAGFKQEACHDKSVARQLANRVVATVTSSGPQVFSGHQ